MMATRQRALACAMISAEQVRALVSARWDRRVAECTAIVGGLNSSAWLVVTAEERFAGCPAVDDWRR